MKEDDTLTKAEAIRHTMALLESVRIINEITQDPQRLDAYMVRIMQQLQDAETTKGATVATQSNP